MPRRAGGRFQKCGGGCGCAPRPLCSLCGLPPRPPASYGRAGCAHTAVRSAPLPVPPHLFGTRSGVRSVRESDVWSGSLVVKPSFGCKQSRPAPGDGRLFRQFFAALLTAPAQYQAAGTGGHALHKTMFAGTLAFFGLVRSFWHILSLYRKAPAGTSQASACCISLFLVATLL